jgi:hypothetical protein
MALYHGLKTPPVFLALLLIIQARVYVQAGRPAEGLALLDEVPAVIGPGARNPLQAELFRLRGDLLLALSAEKAAEAEGWFEQALEVAQEWQARMLALRAALSLSRLWRAQGKTEASQRLLSDAYGRLTEGFTTADLLEARELLENSKR